MRKRACLWLDGVALVALALLLTDRLLWRPGLTADNVLRIRPAMTLEQVEALLGGPAADTFEMPPGRYVTQSSESFSPSLGGLRCNPIA